MGQGVFLYAADAKDHPPAFAPPSWPPGPPWQFEFGPGGGWWFDHSEYYSLEVTRLLGSTRVAFSSGHRELPEPVMHRGQPASLSDFSLARALYASSKFFNWDTRTGHEQFALQTLASTAFPSDKGLLLGTRYWDDPRFGGSPCCAFDAPLPVCFVDLSAASLSPVRMPPGVHNNYTRVYVSGGQDPRRVAGTPVLDTTDGLLGRDRSN